MAQRSSNARRRFEGSANREALWTALEAGLIDMVTTDHSPCPPEMKHRDEGRWDLAWGGIASLGLALPVMWTALERRGVDCAASIQRIAEWMGAAPARLAGLGGKKGVLAEGADADFVVFDPDAIWTVAPEHLHFRHKLSPYIGAELRGRVLETWLRGEQIFDSNEARIVSPVRRAAESLVAAMRDRAQRAIEECKLIAQMSEEPGRITRRFLTPPMHDVHARLRDRMNALGMSVEVDACGQFARAVATFWSWRQATHSWFAH